MGLSGKDGNMIVAKKLQRVKRDATGNVERIIDLGFVGEPDQINAEVLETIMNSDLIPVVAPIGVGKHGETYNINADTVAGAIAGALNADRLLFLTDVPGVMDRQGNIMPSLTVSEAQALIKDGTISGGMIPKVQTCIDALNSGVEAVVILDGRIPHVLLVELFTEHGAGTLLRHD